MSLTLFTLLLLGLLTNLICPFSAGHILQPCFCFFPFCQPVPGCCQPPCSMLVFCIFILIAFFSSLSDWVHLALGPLFLLSASFFALSLFTCTLLQHSHIHRTLPYVMQAQKLQMNIGAINTCLNVYLHPFIFSVFLPFVFSLYSGL